MTTTPQPEQDDPQVTGSPEAIWLVYGDIEHDDTHANLCASGEVTWCEDAQYPADVRYTRTDLVAERVRASVAAERERWLMALDPRRWTAAHSAAWHRNLPDTQAAFDALRSLANGGPNDRLTAPDTAQR